MIRGMSFNCVARNLRVMSKSVAEGKANPETGEVRTYYNLTLQGPDGEIGRVGCDLDVYNSVLEDKAYDFGFSLNTGYDKIFVRFTSVSEANKK